MCVGRSRPETGLELLEMAERAAGSEAEVFGPSVARARASALLASERLDEAIGVLDRGIDIARQRHMPYEEALLLGLRAGSTRGSPDDAAAAEAILRGLGVRPYSTPAPPDAGVVV